MPPCLKNGESFSALNHEVNACAQDWFRTTNKTQNLSRRKGGCHERKKNISCNFGGNVAFVTIIFFEYGKG